MNALLVDQMTPLPPPTEPPTLPPPQPGPRFARSITFAALPTAITCTRLFVASTLQLWGARFLEADAEFLAVELVRHSVQACGVTDEHVRLYELDDLNVIHVRLLGFERSIGIEVWDNATEPARLTAQAENEELHGLALVDAYAKNWGSALSSHGRVTWAELNIYDHTPAGLPIRARKPSPYPRPASNGQERPERDIDFLRRIRNGLDGL